MEVKDYQRIFIQLVFLYLNNIMILLNNMIGH